MNNQSITTKIAKVSLEGDNIIRTTYFPNINITLAIAKEVLAVASEINQRNNGRQYLALVDNRKVKSITQEARKHFASPEVNTVCKACAALIDSPVSRMIGNFFLKLNKPATPTRLFTAEEKAIAWLKAFNSQR